MVFNFRRFLLIFSLLIGFSPGAFSQKDHLLKRLFDSPILEKAQLHIDYARADSAAIELEKFLSENHSNKEFFKWAEFFFKSEIMLVRKQFDSCLILGIKSLEQARKMGREDLETESQLHIGTYYEVQGDYSNTFEHYLAANDLVEKGISPFREPFIYNKMGIILYQDKNFKSAISFFLKASVRFENQKDSVIGSYYWLQNVHSNLGLSYQEINDYKRALAHYQKAINYSILGKFNRERALGVIYSNIGSLYFKLNKPVLAQKYYIAGLLRTLNPKNEELRHGTRKQLEYAQFLIQIGSLEEALKRINNSEQLILKNNFNPLLEDLALVKSNYFFAKHDFFNAWTQLNQYHNIQDSINNTSSKPSFTQQLSSHLLKNAHLEKEVLTKEFKLQTIQKRIYASISIVLLILGISVFILLHKFRKSNEQIKQAIEELKFKSNQLETANRNKDYLLQTVAHDLRTPVGNVLSMSEMLLDENLNSDQQNLVSMVKQSSAMALSIMEDLLDQAQLEKGTIELDKTPHDISGIVKTSVETIRFKANPKNIQIETILPEKEIIASVDGSRLARVIQNLLSNAVKFSPSNSKIWVELSRNNHHFQIKIADNGIGMEPELLQEVLSGNITKGRKGTSGEKSNGIGISICKKMIELHEGNLKAMSKPGEGSQFIFEIPLNQNA